MVFTCTSFMAFLAMTLSPGPGPASSVGSAPPTTSVLSASPRAKAEKLQMRIHGPPDAPCVVYVPGIHGDWTLVQGLRAELESRVRFVEFTYPRRLDWALEDYSTEILAALDEAGIQRAWLIGESFGSQPVWQILSHQDRRLEVDGVILAGGFVRYPAPRMLKAAQWWIGRTTPRSLQNTLEAYRSYAGIRFRKNPVVRAGIEDFIARRTMEDVQVIRQRMGLIATNDPRGIVRELRLPVFALTGLFDPVVPAWPVFHWLRRNCPGYVDGRVILSADHNVLSTAPQASARQILRWMESGGSSSGSSPSRAGQNPPR